MINKTKWNRKLNTHELAWAAGFFEGEGTFSCTTQKSRNGNKINPVFKISIPQMDRYRLERFQNAVGGFGHISLRETKWGGIDVLYIQRFEETQAVAAMLWGFLGHDKRSQYREVFIKYVSNYVGKIHFGSKVDGDRNTKKYIKRWKHLIPSPVPAAVNAVNVNENNNSKDTVIQ
jgi:LAGLIDADG endonuclease